MTARITEKEKKNYKELFEFVYFGWIQFYTLFYELQRQNWSRGEIMKFWKLSAVDFTAGVKNSGVIFPFLVLPWPRNVHFLSFFVKIVFLSFLSSTILFFFFSYACGRRLLLYFSRSFLLFCPMSSLCLSLWRQIHTRWFFMSFISGSSERFKSDTRGGFVAGRWMNSLPKKTC